MSEKISRNEPCPCGSGKKYKKCCGAKEVVSISEVIDREISLLQKNIIDYAPYHFEDEIVESFEQLVEIIPHAEEEELELYEQVHAIWFSLFHSLEDGETILEKFIASEGKKINRHKVREILHSWTESRAIVGTILEADEDKLIFEDRFSGQKGEAVLVNGSHDEKSGNFFIGILLPYNEKFVFYPIPFELPDLEPEVAYEFIEDKALQLGYSDPEEMLKDFFMEIMTDLPSVDFELEPDDLEWDKSDYQEAAEIFKRNMEESGEETTFADLGILLWYQFCERKPKAIQKPATYAAAIHYLIGSFMSLNKRYTQKDLAAIYDVSAGSISSKYQELKHVLNDEIERIYKERTAELAALNKALTEENEELRRGK
ncbi:SEC-C metal-binding domain-containing protein [Neobacillus sp. PS3-34]|uniref:YecA family protein n=1 Tax=Neobacillus sp. PS3-34 TaxID=3070678 RepID=UPI0027E136A0|nr:SEC-C metal-binding domain-containing protein [Neobacillus sp. PS3-34]WML46914.1 SEC-C metal-binding domain-containing protein [Neobacillus sp. PS3-34]